MVEILWDLRWFRVAARLAQWLSYPSSAALHHQHHPLQMLSLVSHKHHQTCLLLLLCIIKQISSNFHFAFAEILPHVLGLVKKHPVRVVRQFTYIAAPICMWDLAPAQEGELAAGRFEDWQSSMSLIPSNAWWRWYIFNDTKTIKQGKVCLSNNWEWIS